jgi:hypothetical protein
VLLIAALLADLVEDLVDPTGDGSATKLFDAASHDQGLMIASAIALLATSVLVVPAVFVIVRTLEAAVAGSVAWRPVSRCSARSATRRSPPCTSAGRRCRRRRRAANR